MFMKVMQSQKIIEFLLEGMIVSNEPGYYEKDKFGIRIENLIYVKKSKKLLFDNLIMVSIDKSLIEISILNKDENGLMDITNQFIIT